MLIKLLCLPTYVLISYEYMNVLSLISYVFFEGRDDYRWTLSNLYFKISDFIKINFLKTCHNSVIFSKRALMEEC